MDTNISSPYKIDVETGKDYYWCSCGQSKTQPFCDGSHKGSEFTPVKFDADESKYQCLPKQITWVEQLQN